MDRRERRVGGDCERRIVRIMDFPAGGMYSRSVLFPGRLDRIPKTFFLGKVGLECDAEFKTNFAKEKELDL